MKSFTIVRAALTVLVIVAGVSLAGQARADAIYTSRYSDVAIYGSSQRVTSTLFTDFDESLASNRGTVSQTSVLSPDGISIVANVTRTTLPAEVISLFDVQFTLTEATAFTLIGQARQEGPAFAWVTSFGVETTSQPCGAGAYCYIYAVSGVLQPGDYTFSVWNGVDVGQGLTGSSTADLRLQFLDPVPLPAAGWMLLSAMGGLGAMRREDTSRKSKGNCARCAVMKSLSGPRAG